MTKTDTLSVTTEDFAQRVRTVIGDRVDSIVLYSSVKKEEARSDSDVDVLVAGWLVCTTSRQVCSMRCWKKL